jgi:hypothetical protein
MSGVREQPWFWPSASSGVKSLITIATPRRDETPQALVRSCLVLIEGGDVRYCVAILPFLWVRN